MRALVTAFLLIFSCNAFAQDSLSVSFSNNKAPNSIALQTKIKEEQPWKIQEQIGRSAFLFSAGSGLGIAAYGLVDEPLRNFTLSHRTQTSGKITRYIEPFGNSKYMIPVSGVIYVSGLMARDPKMQRLGLLLASGLTVNDLVTKKLKDEFQRRRPSEAEHNYYFEGGEGGRHHLSFPSAHTSTAFAFATSVATVYGNHAWVPPVAYGTATLVGLSRIHDNKHWATDVMAGAAVGYLMIKTTNYVLQQIEDQLERKKIRIYVSPRVSAQTAGAHVGITF